MKRRVFLTMTRDDQWLHCAPLEGALLTRGHCPIPERFLHVKRRIPPPIGIWDHDGQSSVCVALPLLCVVIRGEKKAVCGGVGVGV